MAQPFLTRLWSRIEITPTCWLWRGAVSGDGYPRVRCRTRVEPAHRVVYEIVTGEPFPAGMDGHHVCDVRNCVRPDLAHVVPEVPDTNRHWRRMRGQR